MRNTILIILFIVLFLLPLQATWANVDYYFYGPCFEGLRQHKWNEAGELAHVILYLRGFPFSHGNVSVERFIDSRERPLKKRFGYGY